MHNPVAEEEQLLSAQYPILSLPQSCPGEASQPQLPLKEGNKYYFLFNARIIMLISVRRTRRGAQSVIRLESLRLRVVQLAQGQRRPTDRPMMLCANNKKTFVKGRP